MAKGGYRSLAVYLDDFLIIDAIYAECLEIFNCLVELVQELGFQISWHKVVPPTRALIFLGILISSVTQTLELPQDKLVALQDLCKLFYIGVELAKGSFRVWLANLVGLAEGFMGGEPFRAVSLMP